MSILKPKRLRSSKKVVPYTVLRCVMAGHQVTWCNKLCRPVGDRGLCGRLAPHDMVGRTQAAIARRQARDKEADQGEPLTVPKQH